MTTDDLKTAEEFAKTLKISPNHTMSLTDLTFDERGNLVTIQSVYLAGLAAGRKESAWVKCSERDPIMSREVVHLLADDGEFWHGYYEVVERAYYYFRGHETLTGKRFTHWRPLPAPPKEGE